MARIFAPDNPALRNFRVLSLSISAGAGTPPEALRDLIRAKMVAAAFPEID